MTDETSPQTPTPQLPAVAPAARKEYAVVKSDTAMFDTAAFEHIARLANGLASSSFLPDTITKDKDGVFLPERTILANTLIVCSLAHDWGTNPMAVAQSISVVHGKPMFEGKLIAAIIERRLGMRLLYDYTGEPGSDGYGIRVWTEVDAERHYKPIKGTVGEWATKEKNGSRKSIWVGENKQTMQLAYMGARVWCRLNAPGLILGVYGRDEVDEDEAPVIHSQSPLPISASFVERTIPTAPDPRAKAASKIDEKIDKAQAVKAILEADGTVGADVGRWMETVGLDVTWPSEGDAFDDFVRWRDALPKAAAAKPKTTRKPAAAKTPVLSPQMSSALDLAMETIGKLAKEMVDAGADTVDPTSWMFNHGEAVDRPTEDDGAQTLLGRMNRWIDNARREVKTYAENKAADDHQRDEEDAAAAALAPPCSSCGHGLSRKEVDEKKCWECGAAQIAEADKSEAQRFAEGEEEALAREEEADRKRAAADAKAAGAAVTAGKQERMATPEEILGSIGLVIRVADSWGNLRKAFVSFTRMPDWTQVGARGQSKVRALVWERASALNAAALADGAAMVADPLADIFAYRCAIEACDDEGAIDHMWEGITESAEYLGMKPAQQGQLATATEARLEALRGAA